MINVPKTGTSKQVQKVHLRAKKIFDGEPRGNFIFI